MKTNTHGGNVYKFAKERNITIEEVLDFSANINPLGMHPKGLAAVEERLAQAIHYPDPRNEALLKALSLYLGMEKSRIKVGNGAAELLFALCRMPGYERVYVPAPGFSEYALAAESAHLSVHTYGMKQEDKGNHWQFAYPWDELGESNRVEDHSILFLGNPNNPCGTLCDVQEVLTLLDAYKNRHILVVVDESFIDFTDGTHSLRNYVKDYPHLVVVHSLTKFFAIPGLRLGAMISSSFIGEIVKGLIPAWSVNCLAQAYGETALGDSHSYGRETRTLVQEENQRVFAHWSEMGCAKPVQPSVNYMLLQWLGPITLDELMAELEDEYMLIRDCRAYEGLEGSWFRIAIKDRDSNNRLLRHMEKYR